MAAVDNGLSIGNFEGHQVTRDKTMESQWTPPLSEDDTQESGDFHNYLRAFYPYHPASTISSGDGDESSVTVPINQGDVILVHSVQPNGWADGTLLASGARGWLPTNYCEPYDPELMRNLLDALTYTWEFVRGHEDDDPSIFLGQDYVRGMIAGIRLLLQRTNCLSREESIVKNVHTLRRARRYMLSDLSSFSKAASSLQELCQKDVSRDAFYEMLDDIVVKAFKVTIRAIRFLDSWFHHIDQSLGENTPSLTPPLSVSEVCKSESGDAHETRPRSAVVRLSGVLKPISPISPLLLRGPHAWAPISQTSDTLDVPLSSSGRSRPSSYLQKRSSACHRLSYSARCPMARDRWFASDTLTAAHDAFLSSLGVFTGLHLGSRASMELLSETKQAVVSCSALLDIVEDIMSREARRSRTLDDAKEHLKRTLAALIQTISAQADEDDFLLTNSEHSPIQAATSCVRSASVCVAEANAVIERIGDFESTSGHETTGLGISQAVESTAGGQKERPSPLIFEEDYELVEIPLPYSPSAPSPPSNAEKIPMKLTAAVISPELFDLRPSLSTLSAPRESIDGTCSRLSCDTVVRPNSSAERITSTDHRKLPSLELEIPLTSPILFPESPRNSQEQSPEYQTDSRVVSFARTNSTDYSSLRSSHASMTSIPSTVATSPDDSPIKECPKLDLQGSFDSLSESQSTLADDCEDDETELLTNTYAHELMLNKDGQVLGGSLSALVERLTLHDITPDAMFVNTFYLTFRQFCQPIEFAQRLSERFEYVGSSPVIAKPVRLRIYNVLKGWLELHWRCEVDMEAVPVIEALATGSLQMTLPSASKRLLELLEKAEHTSHNGEVPRVLSLQGKTNTVIGSSVDLDAPLPTPVVSKSQLGLLKKFELKSATCSILDFDPLELARQFTLIESKIFCRITPDELLDGEFNKAKEVSKAVNVKAMSKLSTDLANLVTDTILQHPEPKKRAVILKQWVKIAKKCRELNNYDSLVAIVSALNSSMVSRLKKTWDLVSPKTVARLDELRPISEGRMTLLRKLLENHGAPCIPFVGLTLTDLTFNHEANKKMRKLGRSTGDSGSAIEEQYIINFDRYVKIARFIGDLQRFQVPYHLAPVPEMQNWMEAQIKRVRIDENASPQAYYRRSLILEPREMQPPKLSPEPSSADSVYTSFSSVSSTSGISERPSLSAKSSFWTSLGLPQGMHSKERVSG